MASTQIDKVLDIYKTLSQNPTISKARISSTAKNGINLECQWTQRNLERNTKQKFVQDFIIFDEPNSVVESFPVDVSSELLSTSSEDEKFKAILRQVTIDNTNKQFIEIWDRNHLVKNYDLSIYDVHGEVYTDTEFSSFALSPDNTKVLYIAEKKLQKNEPFYKSKSREKREKEVLDKEEISRGTEYVYKPHWGEKLFGKHQSVIAVLNIIEDTIKVNAFVPEEYFIGQVSWAPNSEYLVGNAWKREARYLGLYACTNRTSWIFLLKNSEFRKISADGCCTRSPRFSPDGKTIIWLERDMSGPHHQCHRLMRAKWETEEKSDVLIDVVSVCKTIANEKKFYGLYNHGLPRRCFSNDSQYIFLSTPQRYAIKSYMVNVATKNIMEIQNDESSLEVLDVGKNIIVLMKTSLIDPPRLLVGKFEPQLETSEFPNLHLLEITKPLVMLKGIENLMVENIDYVYDTAEEIKEFNFTYFGPKGGEDKSIPWILMLHGGPHSNYVNYFSIDCAILVTLGFAVVRLNFRGSTGMGSKNVEYLQGKVGEADVQDSITATHEALKKYPWLNPEYIGLSGGSYGGFLIAHLSSQYPDLYKAVVSRNPVIDLAAMYTISDIPDCRNALTKEEHRMSSHLLPCAAEIDIQSYESLPPGTKEATYEEILLKMFNHSPIIHVNKVKAPTLLLLGSKDQRVPYFQGQLWYNRLIANKVKAKMLVYEDNHSLMTDPVEIDNIINGVLWFMEHNSTFIQEDLIKETSIEKVEKDEEKKE